MALIAGAAVLGQSAAAAAQQDPPCTCAPPSTTDTGPFEHVWAGLVYDIFTIDGDQAWTGEDGGRIRHRHPSTQIWSFQPVPKEVRGIIRKVYFQENEEDGWAVSSDGWVLRTENGGATWATLARMTGSFGYAVAEQLLERAQEPHERRHQLDQVRDFRPRLLHWPLRQPGPAGAGPYEPLR